MQLSGNYWPYHPKPLPDEIFSSWLIRIAAGNAPGSKLHAFCTAYWPQTPIWFRDIDRCISDDILTNVADWTGTSFERAKLTSLKSYEGYVFEKLNVGGHSKWVCPLGIYHSTRRLYGQRWCPSCFIDDEAPYFRKHWRMSFTSSCSKHGILLADRCHHCASPCYPHKGSFIRCHKCGADLREHPRRTGSSVALQSDYIMTRLSSDGVYGLPESGFAHSILYFDTWYKIMSLIVFGERSQELRNLAAKTFGGDPSPYGKMSPQNKSLDRLTPHDLHKAKGITARVMEGFPFRLVGLCADTRNWSTQILKNMRPPRYKLTSVAETYLFQ